MTQLHIYDFDGTLFRSPDPPQWWGAPGKWWIAQESLDAPCVPVRPGPEWWIGKVVSQARKSIADPNVWAIVVTGRQDRFFRWRVPELLSMKGLRFDEVILSPGGSTAPFKKKVITRMVQRYPDLDTVHIWEDRSNHLREFITHTQRLGLHGVPHLLKEKGSREGVPMLPLCDDEPPAPPDLSKDPVYAGVILERDSVRELNSWWGRTIGPVLQTRLSHHMTIQRPLTWDDLGTLPLGDRFDLKVVGVAQDDKGQAVVIRSGIHPRDGRTPHVTVAVDGVSPVYSNDLLAKGWEEVDGPTLRGRLGWFNGKVFRFSAPTVSQKVAGRYLLAP